MPIPSHHFKEVGIIHSAREHRGHGACQHLGLREGNNRGEGRLLHLPAVAALACHKLGSPTLERSNVGTQCCSQSGEEWASCSQVLEWCQAHLLHKHPLGHLEEVGTVHTARETRGHGVCQPPLAFAKATTGVLCSR